MILAREKVSVGRKRAWSELVKALWSGDGSFRGEGGGGDVKCMSHVPALLGFGHRVTFGGFGARKR